MNLFDQFEAVADWVNEHPGLAAAIQCGLLFVSFAVCWVFGV